VVANCFPCAAMLDEHEDNLPVVGWFGFAAAFSVNRWLIAQGRGHAVVHQHH
jgi:hypothetical protein